MSKAMPGSVLFCCDHNAIRSPIAEGLAKLYYGKKIFIQSAGILNDFEIDGFAISVCEEIGVKLAKHQPRSFLDMDEWGDRIDSFDLVVALSETSKRKVIEATKSYAVKVIYWPIFDPTVTVNRWEEKIANYRKTRDQISTKLIDFFGTPISN
tara:strand:+ start:105 stop:563 length:459 start_codon:yes stop_codon:yes gene_type:complete